MRPQDGYGFLYAVKEIVIKERSGNVAEHKDKMTDTAEHDKYMEEFMDSKVWVSAAEYFDLHGIEYTAYGIKDAADKEP